MKRLNKHKSIWASVGSDTPFVTPVYAFVTEEILENIPHYWRIIVPLQEYPVVLLNYR